MEALKQAREYAEKILAMTEALVLSGAPEQEEADIAAYAKLLEDREPLIAKLTELKKNMTEEMTATEEFLEVKEIIAGTAKLDEEHLEFMEDVREAVLGALRKIKQGQKVHEGYQAPPPESSSHGFDVKQ